MAHEKFLQTWLADMVEPGRPFGLSEVRGDRAHRWKADLANAVTRTALCQHTLHTESKRDVLCR